MKRCKALLPFQGGTFLEKILEDYRQLPCAALVVVASEPSAAISRLLRGKGIIICLNPHPEKGPFSSLQEGLRILPASCRGFFVHPVDHPAVKRDTLQALLHSWLSNSSSGIKPCYQRRGGHPILLSGSLIPELLSLPVSSSLRDFLLAKGDKIARLPVSDNGILLNINHPADLKILKDHE